MNNNLLNKKRMDDIDNVHTGGGFLGKGTFGCVFSPSLACQDGRKIDKNVVSKLIRSSDERTEMRNLDKIRDLDRLEEFSINRISTCTPAAKQGPNFADCHIGKTEVAKKPSDFLLLLQNYGGISVRKWLTSRNAPRPSMLNIVGNMYNLLRGINILRTSGLVHYDIRTTNVVIDSVGVMRLIDFGKTRMTTDINPKTINERPYHPHPFELKMYARNNMDSLEDVSVFREYFNKNKADYDIIQPLLRPGLFTMSRIWAGVKQLEETLTREMAMNIICSKVDLYGLGLVFSDILTKFYGRNNKDPMVKNLYNIIDGMTDPNVIMRNTIMETFSLLVGFIKYWKIDIGRMPIEPVPKLGDLIAEDLRDFPDTSSSSVDTTSMSSRESIKLEDLMMDSLVKKKVFTSDFDVTDMVPPIEMNIDRRIIIEQESDKPAPKFNSSSDRRTRRENEESRRKLFDSASDSGESSGYENEMNPYNLIDSKNDAQCQSGRQFNPYSKRCCERGEVVNHKTHRCITMANLIDSVNKPTASDPKCAEGKVVNPYTHRCIDKKRFEKMLDNRDRGFADQGDESCDIIDNLKPDVMDVEQNPRAKRDKSPDSFINNYNKLERDIPYKVAEKRVPTPWDKPAAPAKKTVKIRDDSPSIINDYDVTEKPAVKKELPKFVVPKYDKYDSPIEIELPINYKPPVEQRKPMVEQRKPVVEPRKPLVEQRNHPMDLRKPMVEPRNHPMDLRKPVMEQRKPVVSNKSETRKETPMFFPETDVNETEIKLKGYAFIDSSPPKKASPKKASPKKASPKKASPKKSSPKKSSPKKSSPKKKPSPDTDSPPLLTSEEERLLHRRQRIENIKELNRLAGREVKKVPRLSESTETPEYSGSYSGSEYDSDYTYETDDESELEPLSTDNGKPITTRSELNREISEIQRKLAKFNAENPTPDS